MVNGDISGRYRIVNLLPRDLYNENRRVTMRLYIKTVMPITNSRKTYACEVKYITVTQLSAFGIEVIWLSLRVIHYNPEFVNVLLIHDSFQIFSSVLY